jgi:hypothetical protein
MLQDITPILCFFLHPYFTRALQFLGLLFICPHSWITKVLHLCSLVCHLSIYYINTRTAFYIFLSVNLSIWIQCHGKACIVLISCDSFTFVQLCYLTEIQYLFMNVKQGQQWFILTTDMFHEFYWIHHSDGLQLKISLTLFMPVVCFISECQLNFDSFMTSLLSTFPHCTHACTHTHCGHSSLLFVLHMNS